MSVKSLTVAVYTRWHMVSKEVDPGAKHCAVPPCSLCRSSAIVSQETAKPLVTLDLPDGLCRGIGAARRPPDRAVRPLGVEMFHVFADEMVEVLLAKHDEVIQAFLLARLNPALHVSILIRLLRPDAVNLHAFVLEQAAELCGELGVPVVDQVLDLHACILDVHHDVASLLDHPFLVGVRRRRRGDHAPGRDVDEDQHEVVDQAMLGQHLLAEEVARPQRLGVHLDELVP